MNRKITICYDQSSYTYRWLKGLVFIKKELKELGYDIEFCDMLDILPLNKIITRERRESNTLHKAMQSNHDILFMAFHHSTSFLGACSSNERIDIIRKIRNKCNMLIWLDTADSTGTCLFDVLPYVDLYFKKQLLTDRERYCKPIWGGRTFCQYYHEKLNLNDYDITKREYPPMDPKYIGKLRVSWNVGLGDLYALSSFSLYFNPYTIIKPLFTDPRSPEKILDVQYRGSGYSPIAGYPRSECKRRLLNIHNISYSDVTKKIPKNEFIKEGKSSKSILSPFGWGEICGRDFEAIVYGACMIKQDMSHCETFPNIYQPFKTYVPLKWDFSDFEDVLSKSGSLEYQEIAINAREYYEFFYTTEGKKMFAQHVVNELTRK